MEILNPAINLETFFSRFTANLQRVLFLDYDGTLAPFTEQRSRAYPYKGVKERLNLLINSGSTRLVIVSGRTLDDLMKLLKLNRYPELWGGHGAERFNPATNDIEFMADDTAKAALSEAQKWADSVQLGQYCEPKPTGLAFHWRGMPEEEQERIRQAVIDRWSKSAVKYNLALHDFDGGIELRCSEADKGKAVEMVLREMPDGIPIAYLGDDLTDEDAFATLGDKALKVLVRKDSRQTLADVRITPPGELLDFLDRWIETDK